MSKKNVVEIDVDLAENQILKSSKRIEYFVSEFTLEILAMKMKNEEYIVPD
ncbi:TPA: DUF262 domain-containing protein, partial [Escherichia coli]|nr:DUF262 domain-containing protein [Escherichia coli]